MNASNPITSSRSPKGVALAFALLIGSTTGYATSSDDLDARLARLPRPWTQQIHQVTYPEYTATLDYWAEQHPDVVTVQRRGESHDHLGVYLVKITDSSVPDNDKQVTLVTALHGGPERSGSTTALHLIEWLMGDSPLAVETRRKQIVLVMPIMNPHGFFVSETWGNAEGIDVYDAPQKWWDLEQIALKHPEKMPELAAFCSVIDEYQPEMHFDLHGTGLQAVPSSEQADRHMLKGQAMFEVSGSYSRIQVRPWDPRVTEAMVEAGWDVGYGSNRAQADAQRTIWLPDHDKLGDKLWSNDRRTGRFRSLFYGYMKYHTMVSTMEIGWEESGVARIVGVMALGNRPWVYNQYSGYPVNRVKERAGRYVTAYGQTAEQRRVSRSELWSMQADFADGALTPHYAGRLSHVSAVTEVGSNALSKDPKQFIANLKDIPGINTEAIAKYMAIGPELKLVFSEGKSTKRPRIQHGIGFRFCIPYRSPEILDVSVNGHSLSESDTDGYRAWFADGYTQVQINVPPETTREADLFFVTCAYDPRENRNYGWEPPAAVMKQLSDHSDDPTP